MDIKKLGFIIITNETFAFNLVEEVVEKLGSIIFVVGKSTIDIMEPILL
ncbi:hypothetical protein ACU8LW_08225 [Streptococcus pneumoniae]